MALAEPAQLAVERARDATGARACSGQELRLSGAGSGPISLSSSEQSENATGAASTDSDYGDSDDSQTSAPEPAPEPQGKCSAVHTLERDMPDFDYSHLVAELRTLILEDARANPGLYSPAEVQKCAADDWHLSRFLLRQRLELGAAFAMLRQAMRFNHESLASHLRPADFPAEFYLVGGLFPYGLDRKGNRMLYLRVRLHRKTPEITAILQAFVYANIKRLDEEAGGRGISIVIDCQGGGLANADMETLLFIITTLKNYFPKGLSYFLVHEIPWILKPFWHIAKAWVPDEHRQLIKFSEAATIGEFVDRDNLPAYLGGGGALEPAPGSVPENCATLEQAAKLWGVDKATIRRVLDKFRESLPAATNARIDAYLDAPEEQPAEEQPAEDWAA